MPKHNGHSVCVNLPAVLLGLLAIVAIAFVPAVALADDPASPQELQIERQLGCPICTNLPLNICDNALCTQMKGVIRQKLADGETSDQIIAYFVSRYGEGVLLTPPQQGFNLAVWYLPAAAVVLGALVVWFFVRRSVRRQQIIERRLGDGDPSLEDYRRRVRSEIGQGWET
jgi:cytochrome c-type biogenesis protein CcmH